MAQASNTVTFSEFLAELFDHPVPFAHSKTTKYGASEFHYYTFIVKDLEYRVELGIFHDGGDNIAVSFDVYDPAKDRWVLSLDRTRVTDPLKVFSTVFEICKIYAKKYPGYDINFTALNSEPTRVKMYKTMLPRIAKALGRKFSVMSDANEHAFYIEGLK
jgi:hypothetical protein